MKDPVPTGPRPLVITPKYRVFNKVTKRSDNHANLSTVFNAFKLITVKSDLKTKGRYEDDLFVVILN